MHENIRLPKGMTVVGLQSYGVLLSSSLEVSPAQRVDGGESRDEGVGDAFAGMAASRGLA